MKLMLCSHESYFQRLALLHSLLMNIYHSLGLLFWIGTNIYDCHDNLFTSEYEELKAVCHPGYRIDIPAIQTFPTKFMYGMTLTIRGHPMMPVIHNAHRHAGWH